MKKKWKVIMIELLNFLLLQSVKRPLKLFSSLHMKFSDMPLRYLLQFNEVNR